MEAVLVELVQDEDRLMLVAGAAVFALWIVVGSVTRFAMSFSQERTKREIAAYIAEGSMTPEQGERLLKSGRKPPGSCG